MAHYLVADFVFPPKADQLLAFGSDGDTSQLQQQIVLRSVLQSFRRRQCDPVGNLRA